ncbi:MAG: glycosyltransferase [Candidatus Omnitrophota bacterium]|nr:glycosyltransferase [Candidatus Omnitrophota bacterium]
MSAPQPPLKILRVIARLNIGGPARQVIELTKRLSVAPFSTVLVTGQPSPHEGDLVSQLPAQTTHMTIPELGRTLHPFRDVVAFVKLCRVLRQEQPDILHTHTAKAGALGRLAALWYNATRRGKGSRKILTVHTFHGHVLSGYFGRWMTGVFILVERWLARSTDVLVAVSPSVRDDLLRLRIGRPSQMRVVPLGLDLSVLAEVNGRHEGLRHSLRLPPTAPLVGIVGRLVPIKQHELFLRAARRLAYADPSMRFVVVGDGERREQLVSMTQALGLEDRVRFLGWRLDLPAIYADVDCVCLTSRNEGTPVSLIEAMAAGRPVVATAVGGVPDLLGEIVERARGYDVAERGILVQLAHADEGVAAAVSRLLADAGLRERLTRAGREFVCERLTAQRLVQDMSALYMELDRRER